MQSKQLDYRRRLAEKEQQFQDEINPSYFPLPKVLEISKINPREVFNQVENEKRFSYLPSFTKAQDELRENVDRLQETLKITKNKTEENFNNAPSAVEQSQERRFQPRNPYL